jgi:Asp/Glu/hydantoin racemase
VTAAGEQTALGGRGLYGIPLGILMLDTRFPRVPGDVGHAATWPFPVLYRVLPGATPQRVVRQRITPGLLGTVIAAARELEACGVAAITTGCGFLIGCQRELQRRVAVPVLASSLLQVPWVAGTLPPGQAVGVLTIEKRSLRPALLRAAGISARHQVVIGGMEDAGGYFAQAILGDSAELDLGRARDEHRMAARRLLEQHPNIGAFVLECTNMPPYAASIAAETGLPVYDLTTMARWLVAGAGLTLGAGCSAGRRSQ